jgi:hypothetical protein
LFTSKENLIQAYAPVNDAKDIKKEKNILTKFAGWLGINKPAQNKAEPK